MGYLYRILGIIWKGYRGYSWLVAVFTVLFAVFSVVSLLSLQPLLGIILHKTKAVHALPQFPDSPVDFVPYLKGSFRYYLTRYIQAHGAVRALGAVSVLLVGTFFLKNLFRYLSLYFLTPIRNGVSSGIRNALHHKIAILPVSFFSEKRKGDLLSRVSSDVNEVEWSILSSLVQFIRAPFMFLGNLIALLLISYKLTLFALVALPVAGFVISRIAKSLRRDAKHTQLALGSLLSHVEETLSGLKIIKVFHAEARVGARFEEANKRFMRYANRVFRKKDLASPLGEFIGSIAMVAIFWYGGRLMLKGDPMEASVFLVYLALFYQLIDPAKRMTEAYSNIQKGSAAAQRIFEIIDAPVALGDKPDTQAISHFKSGFQFQNASFRYAEKWVLRDISLDIPKGKTIALVGESGSGKTTLANLLLRFYDVQKGAILLDGVDIKNLKISDYRALMGMVTQESILFNDTVYNNIAMGKDFTTQSEVEAAARVANAHDFIQALPQGYQTPIGDGGSKLSGGQQQRISIARAVLKNPPVMLLDEATSALDTESERLVQDALEKVMANRTVVVIAHRLSTIKKAALIAVMQGGKIVERGTHRALVEQGGVYKRFLDLQAV